MHAAKKQKIQEIEAQNIEFFMTAYSAVDQVISLVGMAASVMARTMTATAATPRSPRPITEAFENQPGRWLPDFEGGLNMSDEAAAYQSRVCKADRGLGYYRNGVQFDGFDDGTLVDAKYYPDGGRRAAELAHENPFVGNSLLDQAGRQVKAAGGIPIEWRVAGRTAATKLQQLFRANSVPIKVVYMP